MIRYIIISLASLIIGFLLCFIFMILRRSKTDVGNLRIDRSEPGEKPKCFLELDKDIGFVEKNAYITLKVISENYISD